jgi:hypothetical protein
MAMRVLQITPSRSAGCGVGAFAEILSNTILELNRLNIESISPTRKSSVGNRLFTCARSALNPFGQSLPIMNGFNGQIVLHYVSYGYHDRGCPVWLVKEMKRWKRSHPRGRLITMFHELYATGKPWQSSFWTSPVQRWICSEIARVSDDIVTNREANALILKRMSEGKPVVNLPVFSNIGQPSTRRPSAERDSKLVIFGGKDWRMRALNDDAGEIRAACRKWKIDEVIEIGNGETLGIDLGVPLRKLGSLPAPEVSEWLSRSRLGFVSYPSSYLEKSGIYAAYAAHGVVPVLPGRSIVPGTLGVIAGRHYVSSSMGDGSLTWLEERSGNVFDWYQGHRVEDHATQFARLLRI